MSRIIDLRNAVVQTTQTTLGTDWEVTAHPGTFDLQQLLQHHTTKSAVRIAITGGNAKDAGNGQIDLDTALTAVIIASQDNNGDSAAATAERIASHWQDTSFEATGAQPFAVTRINNLYSATINKQDIAMWDVEAQSKLRIGADQITGEEYNLARIIADEHAPANITTTIGINA